MNTRVAGIGGFRFLSFFENSGKESAKQRKSEDLRRMNPPSTERRKHERLGLRLAVRFTSSDGSPPINCFTENISSNGFYFISPETFELGEQRDAHLLLPSRGYSRSGDNVDLRCKVRIVRVDSMPANSGFGVACQIEKYALTWEEATV